MQFSAVQGVNPTATAPKAPGAVTQGLGDMDSVWNVGDTLTDNDKKLVGWDPGSGKINTLANTLSLYRHSGQITGEVSRDFVDALRTSLGSGAGAPANPALLMAKGARQNPLSSETASALFAILSQNDPGSAAAKK